MDFARSFLILVWVIATTHAQCPSPYVELNPDHTMCRTDKGIDIPLTESEKDAIVDRHNMYRQQVTVPAGNMQKVVWDDNLARVAAKWSRQCVVAHDTYDQRAEPALPVVTIGQNAAGGYPDVLSAVDGWASEIVNFIYGVKTGKTNGHYTQIIFDQTARVGCGQADCSGFMIQICNYAVSQIGLDVGSNPYQQSTGSCSDCSGKCDSSGKLCDCGGKVCVNRGALNLTTCSCTCPPGLIGDLCQTKYCPAQEPSTCQAFIDKWAYWKIDICKFENGKRWECPYRCGYCP